jgi:hypothetical protein
LLKRLPSFFINSEAFPLTINILFVCATLEPGKCGVADYILSLASILCSKGYSCACLAIHDKYYTSSLPGIANSGIEGNLSVFRISSGCPWFSKAKLINEYLDTLNPDCISLQYVPYAYDQKGLPFAFLKCLKSVYSKAKWEITAHELWVDPNTNLRHRILSKFQRLIFQRLCLELDPVVVHVTNFWYQLQLRGISINSQVLPLLSNIPFFPLSLPSTKSDSVWRFVFFGSINREWDPEPLFRQIDVARRHYNIKYCHFISIGRIGSYGASLWDSLQSSPYPEFKYIRLGALSVESVSEQLQLADFGISVVPDVLIEKSSSVAAMIAHGLPVIISRLSSGCDYWHNELRRRGNFVLLDSSFVQNLGSSSKYIPINHVDATVSRFLDALQLTHSG